MEEIFVLRETPYLFGRSWPLEAPKGVVCLVHGLGEHSGRYAPLAAALNGAGFAVHAFDLRGHGKSGGKRGHTPSYEVLLDDITCLLDDAEKKFPRAPLFLYGHSLGGNLVINYILRRPVERLTGAVATGPWLRLAFEPPAYKVWLARTVGRMLPALLQPNGLDPAMLSHDPEIVRAYVEDPLVHDRISSALFLGAYEAGLWVLEHAADLPLPLLLMHGAADQLTSPKASEEFCQRAGELCTFRAWDGLYHEIHNEPQKEEVYRTIVAWLESRLAAMK